MPQADLRIDSSVLEHRTSSSSSSSSSCSSNAGAAAEESSVSACISAATKTGLVPSSPSPALSSLPPVSLPGAATNTAAACSNPFDVT